MLTGLGVRYRSAGKSKWKSRLRCAPRGLFLYGCPGRFGLPFVRSHIFRGSAVTDATPNLSPCLEIAHVLFMDIVAYSTLPMDHQQQLLHDLQEAVRNTAAFSRAQAKDHLIRLPTGDGMALVFFHDPEAPVRCALELAIILRNHPDIKLRMGIHTGPVYHVADINANRNVSGGGINIAQRVMDCGDAGHILVSSTEADVLTQVGAWCRMLHDLGEVEVKHGTRIHLYNLYTEQAGRAELPKKISAAKGRAVATGVAERRAVAVLPFRLLTPNAEDAYLSVALADAVIHQLGTSGEILVRPTSAVERYAQAVDPLQAARELNVQIVAQGGIQKSGTQLRVHVQAWNTADARVIHSAKYDVQIHELFSLQDQLAADLGHALGVQHTAEDKTPVAPPTKNAHAYELFLRAADRLARLNRWDTRTAIEMLEQAVALDPKFADAWARLAEACILLGTTQDPHPRWIKHAGHAVREALARDRHSAEAHCARGRLLWTPAQHFKNRPALRALQEALHINPGCHAAQIWRCLIMLHIGLHEQAREGLIEALEAHPDDAFTLVFIGQTAMYRCDYAEAEEYTARALHLDPAHIWGNGFSASLALYQGKLEEAEEKIRRARQVLGDDPWLDSCQAVLWAQRGNQRKAESAARGSLRPKKTFLHTHHLWHVAAAAYALLQQPAKSIALLRRAGAEGLPNYPAFRDDPLLRPLHSRKDFGTLLATLKREWESYRREFA